MKNLQILVKYLVVAVICYTIGYSVGWYSKLSHNDNEIKNASKEEFVTSVGWAISQGYLIVNTNKIEELKALQALQENTDAPDTLEMPQDIYIDEIKYPQDIP